MHHEVNCYQHRTVRVGDRSISSGYTGQFTSLTFFCLMFCLALDIFLKFRAMEPHTDPSLERKKVLTEQLVLLPSQ